MPCAYADEVGAEAEDAPEGAEVEQVEMFRLYNRYTGEHFYTGSQEEQRFLVSNGWKSEGVGWVAPKESETPVYRLYNPYAPGGDHHYTTSIGERDALVSVGWRDESVGWYSDDAETVPLYRQYNPYAQTGTHNYTTDKHENDVLVEEGWKDEGIAWYACAEGYDGPIMGSSEATVDQMIAAYNASGFEYPAETYASKGAPTIADFVRIVDTEAKAEGVRSEIVFAQAMKETGWLQFGGSVKPEQCNFAGLGATGPTVGGAEFPDVATGIRAQVQHLKAYASTDELNGEVVDPRFDLVKRGVAPMLTDLNGRWAVPGVGYGQSILKIIDSILSY